MKRFQFPLNTVLKYKNQVLDNLRNEQAQILKQIVDTESRIERLEYQFQDYSGQFEARKREGITVNTAGTFERYLYNLQVKVNDEKEILEMLKEKKEKKREEVIEARTDTASIEKLKEKKFIQYERDVQKSEELFIEEFVSNVRSVARQG